jgi:sulfur dioxygenase
MIFRQLFEPESSTYTYLLGCPDTRAAVLIDPVVETAERDLALLAELDLELAWTVETHIHADHVTGAAVLRRASGCRVAAPGEVEGADLAVHEGEAIAAGTIRLDPLHTPGHTAESHCYLVDSHGTLRLFSGDTLLIDGCGRTDFQGGCPRRLHASVVEKLFTLPDETLVYPGHDYQQRRVSSIAQERERNARLGGSREREEFVAIMAGLGLPRPAKIDVAVPANRRCGS